MKVKKTSGKQKAGKLQGLLANDKSVDAFDKLLLNNEKTVARIQKLKKPKKIKQKKIVLEWSHDELYQAYLRDKKNEQILKKKQNALARNVKVSTPVQKKFRNKFVLQFIDDLCGISPIRLDDSIEDVGESFSKALYASLRRQRMKEIEAENKRMESSATRGAKALLAKLSL